MAPVYFVMLAGHNIIFQKGLELKNFGLTQITQQTRDNLQAIPIVQVSDR